MRRIAVLGSTGSIGRSTLQVIQSHPDRLQLVGLAARARIETLAQQLQAFDVPLVAVWEPERARELERITGRRGIRSGVEGLIALATDPRVDVVVVATSGSHALQPLLQAIQAGKRIALASKELLVMAGSRIMRFVQEHGTSLVPIDSEHAGLFQCLHGVPREQVARLVITGSGGPLWAMSLTERAVVSRAQVLAHPKWQMGPKITVDSATLMNKGLEVIEARWLFGIPLERIQVRIHPEAAVHALIELVDGTWLAQMSPCDMRLPIQYALSFPERWESDLPRLQLTRLGDLRFFEPDLAQFPCLQLALDAAAAGESHCVVLNGANEAAVQAYLDEQIPLGEIPALIAEVLARHTPVARPGGVPPAYRLAPPDGTGRDASVLEGILSLDAWARKAVQERVASHAVLT